MIMKKRILILITICLFPLLAGGQALKGSYFSEYSVLRNKLNPAFVPRSSYLGFAGLDNLGLGITSNVGMSNFLFPSGDGSLLTFLHPDVSSDTFLGNLPANPHLDLDFDTDILNIGFFTGPNSFWSIGLGLKVDGEMNLPKELFSFLKNGAANDPQTYNIRNLSLIANAYAEFSLGYSHDFSDLVKGLSVGARVKFLAPVGRADLRVNNLNLTMSSDMWKVQADASAYLMAKGVDLYMNEDKTFGYDLNPAQLGLAGMGAAFDLGVEYRLHINDFFDSVRFSAAVTDLGFVNFSAPAVQKFQTSGEVTYTGIDDIQLGQDMNFEDTFTEIQDQFMEFLDLEEVPGEKVNSRIRPQLYAGVEVPFLWNRMSLGLLYSAKFGYTSTRDELTLALNMRPGKCFNLGVNYSMLNASKSIGWILEFIPRSGIGFFFGSDYTFLEVANLKIPDTDFNLPVIPVNQINMNMRFGFHIAMGNKYDDKGIARREAKQARREARRG